MILIITCFAIVAWRMILVEGFMRKSFEREFPSVFPHRAPLTVAKLEASTAGEKERS